MLGNQLLRKSPNYARNVFGGLPAIRFESGDAFNVGSLNVTYGNVHVFMVSKGSGVGIGATDGLTGWSLDAKTGNAFGTFVSENNTLQQVSLGFDPRTGYGNLIGEIGEIMVFDRTLPNTEKEMIEGYLAHKWGIVDDLAETGFKLRSGLKLYYPFNETDGSVVQDYSSSLRHGQVFDAELNVEGKFGSAIDFTAIDANFSRVSLELSKLEINDGRWSISSWFEAPITSEGVNFKHALTYGEPGYANFRGDFGGPDQRLGLFDGTSDNYISFNASTLASGWHHIVVSSSVGQTKFFMDGNQVGSISDNIILEIETIGNTIGGYSRFSPKLDDFRVYERTLSSTDVQTLYGNGDGDFGTHRYSEFPPSFDNIPVIIPPRNPLVYWTFNELNGTEVRDDSGKNNHGLFDDNLTITPNLFDYSEIGRNGTALRFDGNQTIELNNDNGTYDIRSPFSICLWLKTIDLDAEIFASGQFSLLMSDGFLTAYANIGAQSKFTEPVPIPSDQWIHLIFTWDGNKLFLYKNNEEAVTPVNASGILGGDSTLFIGGRKNSSDGPYEGLIDDVRIFDQYLTAAQRNEVFNFVDPPLIAYFGEEFSYQVETLKGPTEFNATGMPDGLDIDSESGLIFGEANQTGNFAITITAANSSGSDVETFNDPMLTVLKGRQSILTDNQADLLTYGDPPLDLNLTSTSGLPVSLEIIDGNESVDLNGTTVTIKKPGFVRLRAYQDGDLNWLPAQSLLLNFQVMPKELIIRPDDQFRRPEEINPPFTYQLLGLAPNDSFADFNVSVISPVLDGNLSHPTPSGAYDLVPTAALSEKYFYSFQNGILTVSEKLEQEIIFDQNLSDVPATNPYVILSGYSRGIDGNLTNLPINYLVEDDSVARILVTRKEQLTGYWKLDESVYAGAKDESTNYNGSLFDLPTTGSDNAWQDGLFGNALSLGVSHGRVDFGTVSFDSNFTISFWIRPKDLDSNQSRILSKIGIPGMNVFEINKSDHNGSIEVSPYLDGFTKQKIVSSNSSRLTENQWTNITLTYEDVNGTFSLYTDSDLVDTSAGHYFTGTPLSSRFTSMVLGGTYLPIDGIIDDLRVYNECLALNDVQSIYGNGGGDFNRIELIGAGQTRIEANQKGNHEFEKALPVYNYLTVVRVPQSLHISAIPDHSVGDFPFKLEANASSGLPVTFTSSDPALATVVGEYVYLQSAGHVTITAHQAGDRRYEPAPSKSESFVIRWGNLFADSAPGLRLWFDATDVNGDARPDSSNDFISGNRISMWADKSGNTNNPIQSMANQMPKWTPATLNKKPIVAFDSNFSQIFDIQNAVSDPSFVFLVHRQNQNGQSKVLGGDLSTTSTDGFLALEHASGNVQIVSKSSTSDWSISTLRVAPNSQSLWVDGQIVGSQAFGQGALAIDKVGENFNGEIAEVLVFDNQVNAVNRQKIEGYLAHKWSLSSQLPELHPYYEEPPAFGGSQEIFWGGLLQYVEDNETKYKLPDRALGDPAFELVAYSTSGLEVSFISSNTSVATIVGNLVYLNGVGETTISAIQMGDTRYHPATPKSQVLKVIHPVVKIDQNIDFEEIPIKVRDDPPFLVHATASSHMPVTFRVEFGPATVDSNGLVILDGIAGSVGITAAQPGSAYFNPATPVTRIFEVSTKQRPEIIFPASADDGQLQDVIFGHRPLILQGVYATSGEPFEITSSNSTIVEVHEGDKIIANAAGTVSLTFNVSGNDYFVAAETKVKLLNVVKPTRENWKAFRKRDVRYQMLSDRFVKRMHLAGHETIYSRKIFDEDYSDSDGDGYENVFERALGLDSLGIDSPHHLPMQYIDQVDGKQRISFIRYINPYETTGEGFRYIVEQSDNLLTWTRNGLVEETTQNLAGGMERVIFKSVNEISDGKRNFLRVRVEKP